MKKLQNKYLYLAFSHTPLYGYCCRRRRSAPLRSIRRWYDTVHYRYGEDIGGGRTSYVVRARRGGADRCVPRAVSIGRIGRAQHSAVVKHALTCALAHLHTCTIMLSSYICYVTRKARSRQHAALHRTLMKATKRIHSRLRQESLSRRKHTFLTKIKSTAHSAQHKYGRFLTTSRLMRE